MRIFDDRAQAGREVAKRLLAYKGRADVLLYALPRGGVVCGAQIAAALSRPLDVIVTRKIGAPENEEYALGAMAETGEVVWNEPTRAKEDAVKQVIEKENTEAARRIRTYRHGRPLPDMSGKTVILIDDGLATGATMRAAIAAARHQRAGKVIVAIPHGARQSLAAVRREADEVVALEEPEWYGAVGEFYRTFGQTSDQEVNELLKKYAPKS